MLPVPRTCTRCDSMAASRATLYALLDMLGNRGSRYSSDATMIWRVGQGRGVGRRGV